MTPHIPPSTRPTPLCARYAPLLALSRTEVLLPEEATHLREHVSDCSWCQREAAAYDALDAAARASFGSVAISRITMEDVMRVAESPAAETPASMHKGSPFQPARPRLSALGTVAALLVVALLAAAIVAMHGVGSAVGSGPTPVVPTSTATTTTAPGALLGTKWTLTAFVVDGVTQQIISGHAPTLHFDANDSAGGVGGCNGYGASYHLAGDRLSITDPFRLQVYCGGSGVIELESAYFQALPRVNRLRVDGTMLTLTNGDDSVQMVFRAS